MNFADLRYFSKHFAYFDAFCYVRCVFFVGNPGEAVAAPLVRARGRGTICLMENYGFFMIFDDFQWFSQHPGAKVKAKVRLRLR